MEATAINLICPHCKFNWRLAKPTVDPFANTTTCHHPDGCDARIAACCYLAGGGSSCLDCGRVFCKKHLRPTDDERGRGVCNNCAGLRVIRRTTQQRMVWNFVQAVLIAAVVIGLILLRSH